jgi:hypothetical protein
MILEKIYEVSIEINNPINFCANKTQHILTELNNIYVNKCYLGAFIINIIDILQSSSCKLITTNSSGNGIIDVKFSALVFIVSAWDIVIGVKIEKTQSLIIGKYNKNNLIINVTFKPTYIQSQSLHINQLVPIRVIKPLHKSFDNNISVAAVLLTCDKKSIYYRVKGEVSKNTIPEIKFLFDKIIDELKLRIDIDIKKIMFFESLLYSYKNMNTTTEKIKVNNIYWEGPKIDSSLEKYINIFDMLNIDLTGFWSRPLNICRSSPLLQVSQEKPIEYILTAPHLMIIDIAKNILTFLTAIREFTEVYSTQELLSSHENIWNIMRNAQIN